MILLTLLACRSVGHTPGCTDLRIDHAHLAADLLVVQAENHTIPATSGWEPGATWVSAPGLSPYVTDTWYRLPDDVEVKYGDGLLCLRFTGGSRAIYCQGIAGDAPTIATCNGEPMQ